MKRESARAVKHIHHWISCGAVGFWVCIDCKEVKLKKGKR
jgi:hypothetical protein